MDYSDLFKIPDFGLSKETKNNIDWFHDRGSSRKPFNLNWLGGVGNLVMSGLQTWLNYKSTKETNQLRRELVDEQNQLAREESEKAYQRSRPINQVAELRQAGMSQAGALNTLNGGGSYSPAPVSSAEQETPQVDLSGMVNAMQSMMQLQEQRRQFDMQHDLAQRQHEEQKRQFDAEHNLEKDKFEETAGQNAALRNLWHEESERQKSEKKLSDLRYELESANKNEKISAEKAEYIAREARAVLEDIKARAAKIGYENLDVDTIASLAQIQATLEVMGNFGTMRMKDILDWIHNVLDSLPFS